MHKILIAIPSFDMVNIDFVNAFLELEKPTGTKYTLIKNTLIYNARNTVAENAIKNGFDRVLWIDSDMVFPEDALLKLLQRMDGTGADIISAIYFQRKKDAKPVIFDNVVWDVQPDGIVQAGATFFEDYPHDSLFDVQGVGFGCVLTSVDILRKTKEKYGSPFTPLMGLGEDLAFCWRARKLGARIMCDSSIKCGHIGSYIYTEADFLAQRGTFAPNCT